MAGRIDHEAVVRLRLDTTQARAELAALNREGQQAGRRMNARGGGTRGGGSATAARSVRGGRGAGGRAIAFGAGVATGVAGALISRTRSDFGDIVSEPISGFGAALSNRIFENTAPDARAAAMTREQVKQNFAYSFEAGKGVPADAKRFYDSQNAINQQVERAKFQIDQDPAFGGSPRAKAIDAAKMGSDGLKSLLDSFTKSFIGELVDALKTAGAR